ncbi:hypothetical protein V1477_013720 [Vespula maculifrons]|uniref:Uncharacterized protein n=1 Tax=Vespula maculifrons TaxID=7453 RepID=A0ABD2BP25_VESMC
MHRKRTADGPMMLVEGGRGKRVNSTRPIIGQLIRDEELVAQIVVAASSSAEPAHRSTERTGDERAMVERADRTIFSRSKEEKEVEEEEEEEEEEISGGDLARPSQTSWPWP